MQRLFLIGILLSRPLFALADTYTIDPDHSNVGFKVGHLAISKVSGRFAEFGGTFDFNPADLNSSKTETTIKAATIDTRNTKRDDHLRNNDFLDAAKFPEIKFISKGVEGSSPANFKVKGDLTIRGVTKPVILDVEYGGSTKDMQGKERAAFTASTKINRKDFGVSWSKTLDSGALVVGDEVTINLEVEGVKTS